MGCGTERLDFVVDGPTMDLIHELGRDLAAPTVAAVLRKSLAIAAAVAEQGRDSDGRGVLRGGSRPDGVCLLLRS